MADSRPDEFELLLATKAERLAALNQKKPGQKHYKRTLRAFLEADAAAQKAMMTRIEGKAREPKSAEARSFTPAPEVPPGVNA